MSSKIIGMNKFVNIFTGAIIGAIFGGIFGHSLFGPETPVWVFMILIGVAAGGLLGGSSGFEILMPPMCGAAIGLGVSWVVVTTIFGDHIGGIGTMLSLGGAIIGLRIGRSGMFRESQAAVAGMLGMLHAGFASSVILIIVLSQSGSIQASDFIALAPLVFIISLLGALLGYWIERRNS